jgi:transposase-like protein
MNITSLTVAQLKQMTALVEKKETLQAEVARINAELARLGAGESPRAVVTSASPTSPAAAPRAKRRRAERGAVKAAIIGLLQKAGKTGISVKEIAEQLGGKYAHVFAWFYSTGSKIKEIKRVGPGRFGWVGPVTTPVAAPEARAAQKPMPKAKPAAPAPASAKAAPVKAGKPAVSKDTVIAMLKASGRSGISVTEIARRLNVHPQRLYTWFNAVGKRIKEVKKIAPATYIWNS